MDQAPSFQTPLAKELSRRRAYRQANKLLASAGIVLAMEGISDNAPELKMIRFALRAINRAGGIEDMPVPPYVEGDERRSIAEPIKEEKREYNNVRSRRTDRPGSVA